MKGKRRDRQKKRWRDNIKEWQGNAFASSSRAAGQDKVERNLCKYNCGYKVIG